MRGECSSVGHLHANDMVDEKFKEDKENSRDMTYKPGTDRYGEQGEGMR